MAMPTFPDSGEEVFLVIGSRDIEVLRRERALDAAGPAPGGAPSPSAAGIGETQGFVAWPCPWEISRGPLERLHRIRPRRGPGAADPRRGAEGPLVRAARPQGPLSGRV